MPLRLWRLLPPADRHPVDVTVAANRRTQRPGITVHRARRLQRGEATRLAGIPITTPARTLLDLASELPARDLEQALAQAESRRLVSRSRLFSLLARHRSRRGSPVLRALLEAQDKPALTRSEAEERLLALIRRAQLPSPDVNARVGPYEVDFLWREAGLVVEVDGFAFHASRDKFEADRRRDAELAARGLNVIRVTWRHILDEPEALLVRIAQALARATGG